MSSLLLVIDMQKAFINDNTKDLVGKIEKLVNENKYDKIIYTRFINSLDSIYVKDLNYTGCLGEDKELVISPKDKFILDKKDYTACNIMLEEYIKENDIDSIYLCGIDTECCVLKTAYDLFEKKYNVFVLKDYCACTHGKERNNAAIEILKTNIGRKRVI